MQCKILILFYFFFVFGKSSNLFGQEIQKAGEKIGFCGSISSSTPNLYLKENESIDSKLVSGKASFQPCVSITVNLRFHIIRSTTGTGGVPVSILPTIITKLNNQYNEHGIFFNNMGNDFVNNNTYFSAFAANPSTNFNNLIQVNRVTNAINIYILPDNQWNQGLAENIPSLAFVIGGKLQNKQLATSNVIAHELGHCLGLFHTFHGCEIGGCFELPNGSNSSTCGDFVTDTPADPGLTFGTTSNSNDFNICSWKNTATIPNCLAPGFTVSNYTPSTSNTMGYAPIFNCFSSLTDKQGDRARMELLNASSILVPARTTTTVSVNINTAYINSTFVSSSFPLTTNSLSTLTISDAQPWIPKTYSYSKTILSGNMNTSLSPSANNCGLYVTGTNGSNSINVAVTSQCGNPSRTLVFYIQSTLRASPNPVNSDLNIEFSNSLVKEALPKVVSLIEEKTLKVYYEDYPQKLFEEGKFKNQNNLKINIEKWPKGIYFLTSYIDADKKNKSQETVRLQIN